MGSTPVNEFEEMTMRQMLMMRMTKCQICNKDGEALERFRKPCKSKSTVLENGGQNCFSLTKGHMCVLVNLIEICS